MTQASPTTFLLKLLLEAGQVIGHEISVTDEGEAEEVDLEAAVEAEPIERGTSELNFKYVFDKFATSMDLYQRFVPITMSIAPQIASALAGNKVTEFAKAKGAKRDDLSSKDKEVYELDMNHFREFVVHQNEVEAAMETTTQLPRIMIIGLISAYDFHLSQLLRVVLNVHEEITLNSEKSIKYSDLLKYESIPQVRASLIDKEVENVIRESHVEQFKWMEKNLNLQLREDLKSFPEFVEVCERRNLFTHTGGVVSPQYMSVCSEHKVKTKGLSVGSKAEVTPEYYHRAVEILYEIGIKLIFVLWRKFAKSEVEAADRAYNELCFDLIYKRQYKLAEVLLAFSSWAVKRFGGSEFTRRMMIINHANALRLQDLKDQAHQLLNKEDWSASGKEFQLCVAAVREDVDEVVKIMRALGSKSGINAEYYRTWPVFRGLRVDQRVADAFLEIFGEVLITKTALAPPKGRNFELRLGKHQNPLPS